MIIGSSGNLHQISVNQLNLFSVIHIVSVSPRIFVLGLETFEANSGFHFLVNLRRNDY